MSLLAAVFDWGNPAPPDEQIGALIAALPGRAPDGQRFTRVPHALLAFGSRVVRKAERSALSPFRDDRRRLYVVGDVRLDNRDEVRAALSEEHGVLDSDLAILAAAYGRWGYQTAERLVGDYAFAIWDARRREVYAVRDPFGVRSLVYHHVAGRLILASEAAQLLSLQEIDRAPNPEIVVDFLSSSYAHYGPTFFRAIQAVQPGHYLLVGAESLREIDYLRPPDHLIHHPRAEDYREEFRMHFRRAVKDRVDSEYPIVAHLSGGLDSSSIVCTADRIYADAGGAGAPFHIASAVFPGQSHDEAPFINQVVRSVGFKAHRWDGNLPSGREFSHPSLSIPGAGVAFNGGSSGDIELARLLGARVILSGDPGDLVTGEVGLFNELIAQRRWVTLARQVTSGGSPSERDVRFRLLKLAIREEVPPSALDLWRALRWRRKGEESGIASWLRPHLRKMWAGPELRSPPLRRLGVNRLQQRTWDFLRWTRTAWAADMLGTYGASAGVEVRLPMLDARLVQFMLSVPIEHRLVGASRRTLHREAMADILPPQIARRLSKPAFNGAVVRWGHSSLPTIREILEDRQWLADPFVDQDKARSVLQDLVSRPPDRRDRHGWLGIRAIVNLETWLRAVFRYPRAQEISSMSEMRPIPGGEEGGDANAISRDRDAYVPPHLTSVGNVRDLLANAQLSGDDGLAPAPSLG